MKEVPYKKFVQLWNIGETKLRLRKVSYILDSIELNTPSVGLISRIYGEKRTKAYIKLWVVDLVNATNVKRKPTTDQIDMIAQFVVSDFRNLTLSDIYLVLKNVSLGKYGELYENIDTIKLMGWFSAYSEERSQAFIMKNESDHVRFASETRGKVEGDMFQKIGGMSDALNVMSLNHKKKKK